MITATHNWLFATLIGLIMHNYTKLVVAIQKTTGPCILCCFQNSSIATPVNPRAERRAEIVWMVEVPDPDPPPLGALVVGFAFGQTAI